MIERMFRLQPLASATKMMIAVIGLAVLACLISFAAGFVVPSLSLTGWPFVATQAALLGIAAIVAFLGGYPLWAARRMRVEVGAEGLRLHYPLAGRSRRLIPWSSLRIDEARLARYPEDWRLTPLLNIPGWIGRNRLSNLEKALVFLTDGSAPFVYLPTTEGYSLLLQVESADEFLSALGAHGRIPGSA
jgi:hypothetical protein